jgi:hypothetical protein
MPGHCDVITLPNKVNKCAVFTNVTLFAVAALSSLSLLPLTCCILNCPTVHEPGKKKTLFVSVVRLKTVVWEWVTGENQIENEKKRGKKCSYSGTVGHVTTCRVLGGDNVIRKNIGQT